MSSVVLWSCPDTGVTASWNKDGGHTVFVPTSRVDGVVGGVTSSHRTPELAIMVAKRKARRCLAAAAALPSRGGKRVGAGRRPEPDPRSEVYQVRLTQAERDRLALLGGAAWIRAQIASALPG